MLPIFVPHNFRIIAHRGASAYAPENTLPAFHLALEMGVHEVELDTQLTTDGVVVLCHDKTLTRYGHGSCLVEEMAWDDLAALDVGAWFSPHLFSGTHMNTLDQIFATFADDLIYHIELKGRAPGLPAAVHKCIYNAELYHRCLVTSFHYESLVAMRRLDNEMRLGWLVRDLDEATLVQAEALRLFQLCPQAGGLTRAAVERARVITPEVRAWGLSGQTVGGQSSEVIALIHNVLDAGCSGMTINWPDWVRHQKPP